MYRTESAQKETATVNAEATFTAGVGLQPGEAAAVSFVGSSFVGSLSVQRSLDGGTTWGDMTFPDGNLTQTDDFEVDFVAGCRCQIRAGCKTGNFSSGTGTMTIKTGK